MSKGIVRGIVGSIDLARDNSTWSKVSCTVNHYSCVSKLVRTDIGQRQHDADSGSTLAIWSRVRGGPNNVSSAADKQRGGDQIAGEILHPDRYVSGGEEQAAPDDANHRTEGHKPEPVAEFV